MKFPKLLVATEFPPNASGGGPAVVRQMLQEYPAEQIYWWSCFPEHNRKFGQRVARHFAAGLTSAFYPNKRGRRLKSLVLNIGWTPWLASHLRMTLKRAEPEAIWIIPHNWSIPPLHQALVDGKWKYHATIQDYVDVHDHLQRFGIKHCAQMAQMADNLYKHATSRDATSHPMVEDLEKRTGVAATQMLHAGLEREDFEWLRTPGTATNEIKIGYAGSILVADEFALFIKALKEVRKETGKPIFMELFGANPFNQYPWFEPEWMRLHGNLNETELKENLRKCTFGFIPMALHDREPRYNRFSFPTKYISYLAAGLPPLVLAHPAASVSKMAAEYQTGFYSGETNADRLANELMKFLFIENVKDKHRGAILKCAQENFDATTTRKKLWECFAALKS